MDWFLHDNGLRHERINLEHARAYWEKTVSPFVTLNKLKGLQIPKIYFTKNLLIQ